MTQPLAYNVGDWVMVASIDLDASGDVAFPVEKGRDIDMSRSNNALDDYRGIFDAMDGWLKGEPVLPLKSVWEQWGDDFRMYRCQWERDGDFSINNDDWKRTADLFKARDEWITRYGYAIPCAELIEALRALAPIVEIGGGRGYMTRLMQANKIDVVGTDMERGPLLLQGKTAVRRFPERNVFCSWPTLNHTWFRQALKAMRIGRRVIAIIEDSCAEETTREYLDRHFVLEKTIEIPAFPNMNDIACQYRKVRPS